MTLQRPLRNATAQPHQPSNTNVDLRQPRDLSLGPNGADQPKATHLPLGQASQYQTPKQQNLKMYRIFDKQYNVLMPTQYMPQIDQMLQQNEMMQAKIIQ